jgi:uracil-DNA glycosylase
MDSWIERVPLMAEGYHRKLLEKVNEIRKEKTVYPPAGHVLYAFKTTAFDEVKVVIVGQDPYHGPNQAHGLAFSVPEGTPPPPSLRNIFKEIDQDVYDREASDGATVSTDLTRWAEQGVLLLNTILTVEAGEPGSHANLGWQRLTDAVIEELNRQREPLVFMLWGKKAQAKGALINTHHLILEAPHPSPLSAWRGFFGCAHFSKANTYLQEHHNSPISW